MLRYDDENDNSARNTHENIIMKEQEGIEENKMSLRY